MVWYVNFTSVTLSCIIKSIDNATSNWTFKLANIKKKYQILSVENMLVCLSNTYALYSFNFIKLHLGVKN